MSVLSHVSVVEYGVLGTQLTAAKTLEQVAPEPGGDTVITDPAGLPYIQAHGPSKARGASGAIYKWLGIHEEKSFPESVRLGIKTAGKAKLHEYAKCKVIHVVGPNLHTLAGIGAGVVDEAVAKLAEAYANTLSEFAASGASVLRLLPISGGIFAGRFSEDMPWMTFAALERGYMSLSDHMQEELLSRLQDQKLQMCIFGADAAAEFAAALSNGGAAPEGGAKMLSALWPGVLAMISGLATEKAQQFNGTVCVILAAQHDGKYLSELHNGSKATLPVDNLALADLGALVPGARVTVADLKSEAAAKYNGGEAMLKAWSKEHSKWMVKLPDGKSATLPAFNLRLVPTAPKKEDKEGEFPLDLF